MSLMLKLGPKFLGGCPPIYGSLGIPVTDPMDDQGMNGGMTGQGSGVGR